MRFEGSATYVATADLKLAVNAAVWVRRDIIERHKGKLRIRSSQNPVHHGTVFTMFLPHEGASGTQ